ncbi:DHH family phosphoesterase [Pseudalkalibacillus salsuginis]|uniref:DHH family phosphoesterase n=1 Tax=Pseudalkalibacillus salsuginis TaxID=2910972 RepID=UPI001F29EA79|nr:oligoribonuclease [Pseudalkalibacillus salsuginis]MCF6409774.1 oligoribonuclease [Pseudalkalibacillus salsuginis]
MYKLLTHNDLDGVACGIVAKIAFGDRVDVRYNSVTGLDFQVERFLERKDEKQNKDTTLFITDLSVNEENEKALDAYAKEGGLVQLIDHHKTAVHFNDYDWGHVKVENDDGRLACATSLLYEYLVHHQLLEPSAVLEEFVELVRQYDTWEWEQNDNIKAKQLNDLFYMVSIEEFIEKMIPRFEDKDHFEYDEFEQKLLEMEEDKIERYIRRKKRELVQTFVGDYCTGIVHAESYHSELGNELGTANRHLDYITILNMGGKKISFRTIHDDVDVSAVAGYYGGGGHAKAAGCSMNKESYELYAKAAFLIEPMRQDAFRNHYNLKETPQGTLYENRNEDRLWIYEEEPESWVVELNLERIKHRFSDFEAAERYVKRHHFAWLARDEHYVDYLRKFMMKKKKGTD